MRILNASGCLDALTAPDVATVREYSRLTNLPADHIHVIKLVADITTSE